MGFIKNAGILRQKIDRGYAGNSDDPGPGEPEGIDPFSEATATGRNKKPKIYDPNEAKEMPTDIVKKEKKEKKMKREKKEEKSEKKNFK